MKRSVFMDHMRLLMELRSSIIQSFEFHGSSRTRRLTRNSNVASSRMCEPPCVDCPRADLSRHSLRRHFFVARLFQAPCPFLALAAFPSSRPPSLRAVIFADPSCSSTKHLAMPRCRRALLRLAPASASGTTGPFLE
eukprot:4668183-Pleurochrysis_carterae.AAC.1